MRAMKDSGVGWIGEIPDEWRVCSARNVFSEVKTKNTDGQETCALQFKFGTIIRKTNFNADDDNYVAETITNYTVVGPRTIMVNGLNLNYDFKTQRVAIVKEKGVITSAYLALCPDEQLINAEFATYLLKGYESKMAFHNMGTGIRLTLGFREFKEQPILLPPPAEQQRIASYLDEQCGEIDKVLAKTRESIEEYKKLKQSVITEAVTKGIRPDRSMKPSGIEWIGDIPADADIVRLRMFISIIESGVSVNAGQEAAKSDEIGVLKTSSVSQYTFIPTENKNVNKDELNRVSCPVKKNTLIVSRMNTPELVGACGYVSADYENLFLPDRLWQVHFTKECNVKFMWYYLRSSFVRSYYSSLSTGTSSSMQNISQSQFSNVQIVAHPFSTQKEIVAYLDQQCAEIDRLIAKKEQIISELESYKKSLIYECVTGKREVAGQKKTGETPWQ